MTDFDRLKFQPPDDDAMLAWYQGRFVAGFIALHPFFAVEGLDPASCDYGTLILEGSDRPRETALLDWMDQQAAIQRVGKEIHHGSVADIAKQFGQSIGWREISRAVGLADHCGLDRALRTTIGGLKHELADHDAADRLTAHCRRQKIFMPTEGNFQPLMEAKLVAMFRRAGLTEVIINDEFGEEEKVVSLASLDEPHAWISRLDLIKWGTRRLMAPDESLLAWVHWDSFFTALFGTAERLQSAGLSESFEGFWCSAETRIYWLTQDPIPLAQ